MEITIALLLSSIIMMMSYEFFSLINNDLKIQKTQANYHLQELTLKKQIESDFFKAEGIFRTDSGILCKWDSVEVKYEIQDSVILRKQLNTDTFYFKTIREEYWNDTLREYIPGNIINKMNLIVLQLDKKIYIEANKVLGSNVYFK